jgi:mTERF
VDVTVVIARIFRFSHFDGFFHARITPLLPDVFTEATTSQQRKTRTRKRVVPRPPLVDSALLRFLSKQKLQRNTDSTEAEVANTGAYASVSSNQHGVSQVSVEDNGLPSLPRQQQPQQQQSQQRPVDGQQSDSSDVTNCVISSVETELASKLMTAQLEMKAIPVTADDSVDHWMGQFNRNRVAKLLMSTDEGVDEQLAYHAGDCVQNHVLARTARRRVREFLKERDTMWVEGLGNETQSAITDSSKMTRGVPKQLDYGFADVVDVLVENGLSAKDIATILIHTPSIALMRPRRIVPDTTPEETLLGGETIEETVQRALSGLLCTTLKLRRYDARKVLRNCPGLLTKRGSRSAYQVVAAMAKLGVSTSSIARDKQALPALLSRPPAALFRLIAFLSSDAIRMPVQQIGPLIRRNGALELLDAVAPVPQFEPMKDAATTTSEGNTSISGDTVEDVKVLSGSMGRSTEERKKLIDDTYDRMSTTAWTLRNEIGTVDLGNVIASYPGVLLLDAAEQVLPSAKYLMTELGIWEGDLPRVLQLYPNLLGTPTSQMKEVVAFILAQGVEQENLGSIFRSFPALLTLDIESDMMPVVQFLQSIGVKNVGRFISRLPPILGYSVEQELIPKWEFVRCIYTFPTFELSKFPAFFSYPLDRVNARFEYLRDAKGLPISLIAPDLVLRYGDHDFAEKVAGDGDGGVGYSEYLKKRQSPSPAKRRNNSKNRQLEAPKKERAQ